MGEQTRSNLPRYLFVTGRLAEFSLRKMLDDLSARAGFTAEVAVLPITVAALMTPRWVARHLDVPDGIDRVILPGYCSGDLAPIIERARGIPVEPGPLDLRDLPRHFGRAGESNLPYGRYDIEILAEINHAPRLERQEFLRQADQFHSQGADVIDLGCDPGHDMDPGRRCSRRTARPRLPCLDRQLRLDRDRAGGLRGGRACPERQRNEPHARPRLGRRSGGNPRPTGLA